MLISSRREMYGSLNYGAIQSLLGCSASNVQKATDSGSDVQNASDSSGNFQKAIESRRNMESVNGSRIRVQNTTD